LVRVVRPRAVLAERVTQEPGRGEEARCALGEAVELLRPEARRPRAREVLGEGRLGQDPPEPPVRVAVHLDLDVCVPHLVPGRELCPHERERRRRNRDAAVEQEHVVSTRFGEAGAPRAEPALVRLRDDASADACDGGARRGGGVVGRAVVDEDEVEVERAARVDGGRGLLDGACDASLLVVDRDDDAEQRAAHSSLQYPRRSAAPYTKCVTRRPTTASNPTGSERKRSAPPTPPLTTTSTR